LIYQSKVQGLHYSKEEKIIESSGTAILRQNRKSFGGGIVRDEIFSWKSWTDTWLSLKWLYPKNEKDGLCFKIRNDQGSFSNCKNAWHLAEESSIIWDINWLLEQIL